MPQITSRLGLLWESRGHVDVSSLLQSLAAAGYNLARGHKKNEKSGGPANTQQVMLVFDNNETPYSAEQVERNAEVNFNEKERQAVEQTFFGSEPIVGPRWKGKIMLNGPAGRVPPHLYVKFGSGRDSEAVGSELLQAENGNFVLVRDGVSTPVTLEEVLRQVTMVRVSFNLSDEQADSIPWKLEGRPRFETVEAHDRATSVIDRMRRL